MTRSARIEEAARALLMYRPNDEACDAHDTLRAALALQDDWGEYRRGVEDAARVADKWEAQYPVDIWPEDGTSIDAKAAKHGRHVARMVAEDIRALAPPPAPGADKGES